MERFIEQFLIVTTTTEHPVAARTCAALEEAGIPVMTQHVEINDANGYSSGFRLLVPSQFSQTAMKLVAARFGDSVLAA